MIEFAALGLSLLALVLALYGSFIQVAADLGSRTIRDEIVNVYGALDTTLAGLSETYSGLHEAYAELIGLAKLAAREVASR